MFSNTECIDGQEPSMVQQSNGWMYHDMYNGMTHGVCEAS